MDDDWPNCDAEGVVTALSTRYRFSRANAVQLLRDQGILRPRAEVEHDDDVEEAEGWDSEEDEEEWRVILPMPGQDLVSIGAMVVGTGGLGFQDGVAAAAKFGVVRAMLHLPDGRVLVADRCNHCVRVLSADLQQVGTVAGDGEEGHRNGAAAQAQFHGPSGFALLSDGRVLVVDKDNNRIRMLSADLQQVSTVAGDGEEGHQDGAAAQARFNYPTGLALLPDGIRVLSADLQQVSTLTNADELDRVTALELLPDGRLLVGTRNRIHVLEGFPAAPLSTKPSHKPPKKKNQQKKKKRALAGGARSSGLVPKRSRSGASSSSSSMVAASNSDSEGEKQPGGSAAEAEPLGV